MAVRTSSTLQTADRALLILQQFADDGQPLTVSELARSLGLHRSTVSRLVSTLESRGFLERSSPGDALRLGPEIVRLGRAVSGGSTLVATASPVMAELAQRIGETVTLAVPSENEVVTVAQVDGRHFVSSGDWVGVRTPAHCCSDGKVLLAFGALRPPAGRLRRLAANTIVSRRSLETELEQVRHRGYAVADGELERGLVGVAVPVLKGGACIAALCISGPNYRLGAGSVREYAPLCADAARRIAR
jgi:DNA-binding IclR family transcriptional regulator